MLLCATVTNIAQRVKMQRNKTTINMYVLSHLRLDLEGGAKSVKAQLSRKNVVSLKK